MMSQTFSRDDDAIGFSFERWHRLYVLKKEGGRYENSRTSLKSAKKYQLSSH